MGKSDRDSLPHLNDPRDYLSWQPSTIAYLITKRLWKAVDPNCSPPAGVVARQKWDDANTEAYGEIFLLLGQRMRDMVVELQTTDGRRVWQWLSDYCLKNNTSSRMSTRKAFYDLKHDPVHPVSDYITSLRSITRQLRNFGCEPKPDEITDKLLSALDNTYGPIRTVLVNGSPRTFEEMCAAIEEYEETELGKADSPLNEIVAALRATSDPSAEPDWGNTKEKEGVCWRCGCAGHQARYCVRDMPPDVKKKVLRMAQQAKLQRTSATPAAPPPVKKERINAAADHASYEDSLSRAMGAVVIDATTPAGIAQLQHMSDTGERANFVVRGMAPMDDPWANPWRSPRDEPLSPSSPSPNFAGACLTSTPARGTSRSRSRGRNCRGGRRSDLRRSPSRHKANALADTPDADDDDPLEEDPNESYWRSRAEDEDGGNDSDYSF